MKWAIEVYPAAAEAFALNHSEAKVINLDCNEVLKIAMDGDEAEIRLVPYLSVTTRELFIHGKAIVPYVQLSTNCGLDNVITAQILFSLF